VSETPTHTPSPLVAKTKAFYQKLRATGVEHDAAVKVALEYHRFLMNFDASKSAKPTPPTTDVPT